MFCQIEIVVVKEREKSFIRLIEYGAPIWSTNESSLEREREQDEFEDELFSQLLAFGVESLPIYCQ